jgi:hypothetical protein
MQIKTKLSKTNISVTEFYLMRFQGLTSILWFLQHPPFPISTLCPNPSHFGSDFLPSY